MRRTILYGIGNSLDLRNLNLEPFIPTPSTVEQVITKTFQACLTLIDRENFELIFILQKDKYSLVFGGIWIICYPVMQINFQRIDSNDG